MKKFIFYIIIAWSLLAFVGYNVLTVEATTDKQATQRQEEKDCRSISEPDDDFYCKQFDWSAFYPDRETVEELCDASEDYAKNPNNCDKAYDLVEKTEEKAAEEDALCDDEDAETTSIPLCKSHDLTLGQAFAEKYNKENCEDHNGEWIDGECDFYENQMKEGWEVDEDNFYKKVCEDEKNESDECKKHRLSIEDGE